MRTDHIRGMLDRASNIAAIAQNQPGSIDEVAIISAVNLCRHAAEELEAERLDHFHGVPQT